MPFTGGLFSKCIGSYNIYQRSGVVVRIQFFRQKDTVQSMKLRIFAPGTNEMFTLLQGPIDRNFSSDVAWRHPFAYGNDDPRTGNTPYIVDAEWQIGRRSAPQEKFITRIDCARVHPNDDMVSHRLFRRWNIAHYQGLISSKTNCFHSRFTIRPDI